MELEYEIETIETSEFVKTHKNRCICIICQVQEPLEEQSWDRYSYKCCKEKHFAHSRCARLLNNIKGHLFCAYCGKIKDEERNKYCFFCEKFGHSPLNCKKMLRAMNKQLKN